ncbi:MAG: rod shape-determining protein MreD [Deltaproteobacteria bacterium]|nr:rod shape-determining protein MreD [Deltaproteobacteria bacterium]
MKFFLAYLAFALIFLVIESTLFHSLPPPLIPDVILIMAFYLGFTHRSTFGAFTVFILGYAADIFSAGIIGTSSFTLVFVFAVTSLLARIISLNSLLVKIGGTIFMSILKGILTYMVLRFLNQEIPFYIIFPAAASTGIVSPFIFTLLKKITLRVRAVGYSTVEKIEL